MHRAFRDVVDAVLRAVFAPLLCLVLPAVARVQAADADTSPSQTGSPGAEPSLFQKIWDFEAFHVGGAAVTVSQLVIALAILVAGIVIAHLVTRMLRRSLLKRVHISRTSAAVIEKIMFYLLLVIAAMLTLQTMRIPITLFAFLGGAMAIGLGFGAQNILNNFISGMILMFERPVRLGDYIEVEDHLGRIEDIRFRCTRIRRIDGVEVLVPNSVLLEKNVINWTLSDKAVRTSVRVGVIYGSPTEQVSKLIRQAVDEHKAVLRSPEPILVFDDFGDSSLVFEIFFWTEVATMMDLKIITSDIRFRIDELFREAGLVIAFPQRDVHLDTVRPLEVRLAQPPKPAEGDSAS